MEAIKHINPQCVTTTPRAAEGWSPVCSSPNVAPLRFLHLLWHGIGCDFLIVSIFSLQWNNLDI